MTIKNLTLSLILLGLCSISALGQVESPAVGFSILDLSAGDGENSQLTFKAPGYQCAIVHQAISTAVTSTSLVDTAASWRDDTYNGANGPHYVEIVKVGTSSTHAAVGTRREIVDTVESSRSLLLSAPWPNGVTSPVNYRIVKHWTIRELFGATKEVGIASSISGTDLVDATAQWTADQFNGENGPHFVEITKVGASLTDPLVGTRREIIDTDEVTRTITANEPWPSITTGTVTYRIVRHMAVRSNTSGNLRTGSPLSADSFQLWDGDNYETYYYQTVGIGGIGWRKAGDQFTDAGDTVIQMGQGIIFRRGETTPLSLVVRGVVKDGVTPLKVEPGFNFLANPYAFPMTLASSALHTGNTNTGIAAGSLITADQILVWNGAYYDTSQN
ncbi:MAG: hypothetical protein NTV80_07525 [Verrucomicrobia bacterium]|nr:hypothetical protein [Verrucomicrobiota bacterium]